LFKDALNMMVALWKMKIYPKVKFLLKLIAFFPTEKAPLVTAKHSIIPEGKMLVCDIELAMGQVVNNVSMDHELTGSSMLGSRKRDSGTLVVSGLKATLE
jgi:hypothetical protein